MPEVYLLILFCIFLHCYKYLSVIVDIDECAIELDNCHENATCNNTFGSFECICNSGFDGDGVNCTSKTGNLTGL